jgi:DNA invertase Pin-like site-specific DNA recombinase
MRAALYLRVSTTRQAEKDLSIPDQRRQAKAYCERKGWAVAAEYIEPGASATDDKRPEFQRLIADATSPEKPFDVIVFHSLSKGVALVSITQELGDDPMADMARQILTMFDEYQSKENSKHVTRP